jgi:hypothetical protein
VAARLRRELHVDVEMVRGHYGEFKVLVDGKTIIDGGATAFLGDAIWQEDRCRRKELPETVNGPR